MHTHCTGILFLVVGGVCGLGRTGPAERRRRGGARAPDTLVRTFRLAANEWCRKGTLAVL
jgi:hypothetical protein